MLTLSLIYYTFIMFPCYIPVVKGKHTSNKLILSFLFHYVIVLFFLIINQHFQCQFPISDASALHIRASEMTPKAK